MNSAATPWYAMEPTTSHVVGSIISSSAQWKESPQAQVLVAFGLSIVKPWASMVSA